MLNNMVFILLGVVLIVMRLFGVEELVDLPWYFFGYPFFFAMVWFEVIEPFFGLNVRRQQAQQARLLKKIKDPAPNKKPRRHRRGFLNR